MKGPVEGKVEGKKKNRRPMDSIAFERVHRALDIDGISYQTKRRVLLSFLDSIEEKFVCRPGNTMPPPAEAMPGASPWYPPKPNLPNPSKDSR